MNRRTDSSSWKILSTSNESSERRMPIEMESLCTSMPRCVNERCERLDIGRLLSAWGSFCLRVDDPRQHRQRSRPFHDDFRAEPYGWVGGGGATGGGPGAAGGGAAGGGAVACT